MVMTDSLHVDILTLFPEMFGPVLSTSIPGRAASAGAFSWSTTDIREFSNNKHNKVDDRPFGGGPGMVMMCDPVFDAVAHAESQRDGEVTRILLTPQGERLTQGLVNELATKPRLLLLCGHYEGIDERVIEELEPLEVSLGDYVLSGGELGALVLIDAVVRMLPGVLGHEESAWSDSFQHRDGAERALLDCPHYTRPRVWNGREVPEVLLSGDHGKVDAWRLEQMLERTRKRRPDLFEERSGGDESSASG